MNRTKKSHKAVGRSSKKEHRNSGRHGQAVEPIHTALPYSERFVITRLFWNSEAKRWM